ncbi:hypothetical protein RFI_32687, partial [Reticulomyxa filosa]
NNNNNNNNNNEMLLFCRNTGLSIRYDAQIQTFHYRYLPMSSEVALFHTYAYAYAGDVLLCFGGWDSISKLSTDAVFKYSIKDNAWSKCKISLPSTLSSTAGVLVTQDEQPHQTYVHLIGGTKVKEVDVSWHLRTKAIQWMSLEEIQRWEQSRFNKMKIEQEKRNNKKNKKKKQKQ